MTVKTMPGFITLTVLAVALLGFLVLIKWDVRAELSNSSRVTVAQNETQTTNDDKNTPAPEGEESESNTEGHKESTSDKKTPLKNFQPSERIEAEQAVDFPYDI